MAPLLHVVSRIDEIFDLLHAGDTVAIDIPIGLPEAGARACDREARALLGWPRMTSVFPAPIRPVLAARSYDEACAIREGRDGKRMSKQAWNIVPKIREVDDALCACIAQRNKTRARPAQLSVHEVHPEVSFYFLAGGRAAASRKKSVAGRTERLALLRNAFAVDVEKIVQDGSDPARRRIAPGAAPAADDAVDALALLWSARRIAAGSAVTLPAEVPYDTRGLPMKISA